MNRLTAGLLLGLIAGVPGGVAVHAQYMRHAAPMPQPIEESLTLERSGSSEAAKDLAYKYVMQSMLMVGNPKIWADTAVVEIFIARRKCVMDMRRVKVDEDNRSGWQVTGMHCE